MLAPLHHLRDEVRAYALAFAEISHNARMYLLASVLLAVGMGVQLVLYNLYLIELGFAEDLVGQVAAAAALGVAVGGLPAGLFYSRFGGKVAFGLAVVAAVVSMALRALSVSPLWLITWAAVNGLANSLFFVSIFPFITDQSTPRERPHLYGLNQAVWTGLMVLGSFVSGYLPGLWPNVLPGFSPLIYQRLTLLAGTTLGFLALIPIALMRVPIGPTASTEQRRLLPGLASGRAIVSGAIVLALFGLITGLTTPFYNTFFLRTFASDTAVIGTLISLSQMMGLISAVFVPVVVRRLGLVIGPAATISVAALLTLVMGLPVSLGLVAVVFLLRVGLEWLALTPFMNLVMEIVPPADRGAMSGVRLITNYGAQALAGALGGWLVVNTGYAWLFAAAAAVQLITGFAVWALFHTRRVALETT